MVRGKAFLLVGHKHWGKSCTLEALTDDDWHPKRVSIGGHTLWLKRMSNDDRPNEFTRFIQGLDPTKRPLWVIAFCPVFDENAEALLRTLSKHYDIFSFVLRNACKDDRQITSEEIRQLKKFGLAEVLDGQNKPAMRSRALRQFLERHL